MADIIDINVFETTETVAITVTPNLTTININSVTGGLVSSVNGQVGDVVIGASDNNFTNTLKTKLDGIASGAEVNVNADWNAVSGDAQILNKPTIPAAVTQTSQLTNNGADGTNPFITALDIPTAGQAGTLVREVKNMTGATLTKGTVVYISGANGNKALVSKALATTDALSARTFGLLQSNISNNGLGYCVIIGDLIGLDTSSFTEGAQLYLSGVTAGTYTASKILAPTHLVYVGKVTRSHPTLGQIEVGIQNGYELEEIHDVAITSVADKQLLSYDLATDLWKNKSVTTADISDSTGKRYQTENQNTFNDATSSIQTQLNSKQSSLGYTPPKIIVKDTTDINLTGTVVNTIISSYLIPANTFATNDIFKIHNLLIAKAGTGTWTIRIYVNSILSLSGATTIGTGTVNATTSLFNDFSRTLFLNSGNLKGLSTATTSLLTNINEVRVILNVSFNTTINNYFIVAITPSLSTDVFTQHGIYITN